MHLSQGGGRGDERRHFDLYAPSRRCRPDLRGMGRFVSRHLPRPPSDRAVHAAGQTGAAGADARCGLGGGDPAGADRQSPPQRALLQGVGAATARRPANIQTSALGSGSISGNVHRQVRVPFAPCPAVKPAESS